MYIVGKLSQNTINGLSIKLHKLNLIRNMQIQIYLLIHYNIENYLTSVVEVLCALHQFP